MILTMKYGYGKRKSLTINKVESSTRPIYTLGSLLPTAYRPTTYGTAQKLGLSLSTQLKPTRTAFEPSFYAQATTTPTNLKKSLADRSVRSLFDLAHLEQ